MAKQGQQIDELFISLGLDIAELQLGFDTAGKTVSNAISQLNSSANKIKIQMDTDLSKLEGVGTELDKIEVKYEAINKQLDLQRQKEEILAAVLKDAQKNTGADSGLTRKAETDLLRQQKLIAQTEAELRKLAQAKVEAGGTIDLTVDDSANVTVGDFIKNLQEIKGISTLADSALSEIRKHIDALPIPVEKAISAFQAFKLVIATLKTLESTLLDIAKPAITAGDNFYVMSRGMQMSIKDAAKLSTICKVTGIDINEVNSALRRFSTQINRAGDNDNAMLKMLKKYGAEVRDSSGKIKNEIDLVGELARAFKKAQAEGNGAAFRDIVGGKFWSGDFVTFLEDYFDNVEQAKKVVKNGLFDPARAHAIQGELNTLEAQAGQLNSAFSSAFMPIAEKIVPQTTQRLGELTKVIADNAEGIKTLGNAVADVVNSIETVATKGVGAAVKVAGAIGDLYAPNKEKSLAERYLKDTEVKSAEDLMKKELQRSYLPTERAAIENNPALYQTTLAQFESYYKAIEEARKNNRQSWADFKRDSEIGIKEVTKVTEEELEASAKRIEKYAEELSHLDIDLKFHNDDYNKSIAELDLWYEKVLPQAEKFEEEQFKLAELYDAKREKIEMEREDKISQIRKSANSEFQSDIQNRIEKIEEEKDSWIKAGMAEAEAVEIANRRKSEAMKNFNNEVAASITSSWQNETEKRLAQIEREKTAWIKKGVEESTATAWAENEKAKVIKNLENEVSTNIDSIWQTELQKRLAQIEKEKQAWIDKGVSEVKATEWAEQAKADATKNAAMNVLKSQYEEYKAYQKGGYKGLQEYNYNQLIKSGIDPKDLQITQEQLSDFQNAKRIAQNSLLPNFMTQQDKFENAQMWGNYFKDEVKNFTGTAADYETAKRRAENYNTYDAMQTSDLNNSILIELSTKLTDLTTAITQIELSQPVQKGNDGGNNSQQQLSPVNVTVQINEAHAWDSEHIQDLADKVAEVIEPELESALGNNSNSY